MLAALIGGAVAFAAADRSTTERIYGVVNIRPVATLANDRVDLVEDLDAALTLPSVLSGPAEDADMSVADLRQDLTVQPLGETSFVRVGVAVHDNDETAAEDVLRAVVASAATFMSGENAGAVADDTLGPQLEFVDPARWTRSSSPWPRRRSIRPRERGSRRSARRPGNTA